MNRSQYPGKHCHACGQDLRPIGEDSSERYGVPQLVSFNCARANYPSLRSGGYEGADVRQHIAPHNFLATAFRSQPKSRRVDLVREKMKNAPNDADLHGYLAVYLAKSGDSDGAAKELVILERLSAKSASNFFKVALANEILGRREPARSRPRADCPLYSLGSSRPTSIIRPNSLHSWFPHQTFCRACSRLPLS